MKLVETLKLTVLSLVLVFSASMSLAACNSTLSGSEYDQRVNERRINQQLFNDAILHYTNFERCKRGLRAYRTSQDVFGAAVSHAENMASTRTYSHTLPIRRLRTLRDRLYAQNASFRRAGENIAKTFVYVLNGRGYIDRGRCTYIYTANRQPIPIHTYRSLAQELVDSWKNSAGHRENLFNRRMDRMGAGLGIDKNTPLCGELYAAQVVAG